MRKSICTFAIVVTISVVMFAAQGAQATFSGRNGRIAFRRALGPQRAGIFTINPDGTHERQLTHPHQHRWITEPNWSPDGRRLVYDVWRGDNQNNARISTMRPNGHHRQRLDASCSAPCLTDSFPSWSPSADRIAFGRGLGPTVGSNNVYAIFTMRADGSGVRQITQVGADPNVDQGWADDDPTWSPDGSRLAFQRTRRSDNRHAVFTVALDGTGLRRITPWKLDAASPDWSPNGKWIAFRTDESSDSQGAIGLVHPNGNRRHVITSRRPKWGLLSFSPSGSQIVASLSVNGGDLYRMSLDGTHIRLVVGTEMGEGIPAWGPKPK